MPDPALLEDCDYSQANETCRIEARASYQCSIQIRLRHQRLNVIGLHATPV